MQNHNSIASEWSQLYDSWNQSIHYMHDSQGHIKEVFIAVLYVHVCVCTLVGKEEVNGILCCLPRGQPFLAGRESPRHAVT